MLSEFKDLLDRVSSPGDMGVVLIAGVAGFLIDGAFTAHGVYSPGNVGVCAAAGALGLKKSTEAGLNSWWFKRKRDQVEPTNDDSLSPQETHLLGTVERAKRLMDMLTESNADVAYNALKRELALYEQGIVSEDQLSEVVKLSIAAYREASNASDRIARGRR